MKYVVCSSKAQRSSHALQIIRYEQLDLHMRLCEYQPVSCSIDSADCTRRMKSWLAGDVAHGKGQLLRCKHDDNGLLWAVKHNNVSNARTNPIN